MRTLTFFAWVATIQTDNTVEVSKTLGVFPTCLKLLGLGVVGGGGVGVRTSPDDLLSR